MSKTTETAVMPRDEQASRARRKEELAAIPVDRSGFWKPRDASEAMQMAEIMARMEMGVAPHFRGMVADCFDFITRMSEYGFNPISCSWFTYRASKDNAAPLAYEAKLIVAIINRAAPLKGRLEYQYSGEGQHLSCVVSGTTRHGEQVLTYESPSLGSIYPKNSPLWKSDPKQQLAYYSARAFVRRHFPEVLFGIYGADEVEVMRQPGPDDAKVVGSSGAEPEGTAAVGSTADRLRQRVRGGQSEHVAPRTIQSNADTTQVCWQSDDIAVTAQISDVQVVGQPIDATEWKPSEDPEYEARMAKIAEDVHAETRQLVEATALEADDNDEQLPPPAPENGFPMDQSWSEGEVAFRAGVQYEHNPYRVADDRDSWAGGWRHAEQEAKVRRARGKS